MKTIGFRDLGDPRGIIMQYCPKEERTNQDTLLHGDNRHKRIADAMRSIKGLGQVRVFLINGRKYRPIFQK